MTGLNQPLGYFKKSAKALLAAVRSRDAAAEERIRVLRDTPPEELTLMKAQHVIALEHGFPGWAKLLETEAASLYAAISRFEGRRRFDPPTQERVRELVRSLRIDIPEESLRKPIHVLSIYAITGGVGASAEKVLEMARRNARERPWGVDIGNYQRMVKEEQALLLLAACREEGIPFWQRPWLNAHLVLSMPDIFPGEFKEICDHFGVPVREVKED